MNNIKQQQDQEQDQEQDQQQISNNMQQKSDQQVQAEAILNALKDLEQINQKRIIKKSKNRKLEKDW